MPRDWDWHPISPKTAAPHNQPTKRKKRKGKQEKTIKEGEGSLGPLPMTLLLNPASPTPLNTGSGRSFHSDTEKGVNVL